MTVAETELPVESEAWWNVDPKDDQETMQLLAKFEGLYEKLCEVAVGSSYGANGASTSSFSQVNDNSRGCDFE
ncbi:unnamed protein product [Arabis nemorensis]|uniref:Uncharacterized protein n=1 Tax=Arabis nemorensis TaxID=586526 RepID=A0A565AUJ8_9BRAS|nr:unnamed protein product [Arabis nemorensis]